MAPRLEEIYPYLRPTILTLMRVFYLLVMFGILMLFFECYTKYSIKYFHELIRFSIKFMFPINILLGKCIYIKKDSIRESFVQVNNSFIKKKENKILPEKLLVLLPHCLQNFDCIYRVTNNIEVCQECGKCIIQKFKEIKKKTDINIAIATGGTLARKIIVQAKPDCIIAVACQRDLVDGLLDVFPIPVYGVLNETPNGPCINTTVQIQKIEKFIENFVLEKTEES